MFDLSKQQQSPMIIDPEELNSVQEKNSDVWINDAAISKYSKHFRKHSFFKTPSIFDSLHNIEDQLTLHFLFNAVNFCFWNQDVTKDAWSVVIDGSKQYRTAGMVSLLNYWYEQDLINRMLDGEITLERFYIGGTQELQFHKQRFNFLYQAVRLIQENFQGSALNLIEHCHFDVLKINQYIAQQLSNSNDVFVFRGKELGFFKRNQLTIFNFTKILDGKKEFKNLHRLTGFADYRLPQILNHLGITNYSSNLEQIISEQQVIPEGSELDLEIRISTVLAIHKLSKESRIPQAEVDQILWSEAKTSSVRLKPHHRTKTVYY